MRKICVSVSQWPRRNNGDYIFDSTEEAIFFAHLAVFKEDVLASLSRSRSITLGKINIEESKDNPNLQRMFDLAVRGQFFRECLEEVERIKKEVPIDDKSKHFLEG